MHCFPTKPTGGADSDPAESLAGFKEAHYLS